jgi:hypothetical protein
MRTTIALCIPLLAASAGAQTVRLATFLAVQDVRLQDQEAPIEHHCPVDVVIDGGIAGGNGGMAGSGWDGGGQGAATIFFHVEGVTADFTAGQRSALLTGLQTWANIVQIDFVETPLPNLDQSIDFRFASGNHCAIEADECGDNDCPFDGAGGTLAHAGFPPGVNSACVNPMAESWAGNVHFDEAETWEQDNAGGSGPFSLTLIACHEIGHAIGLTHDTTGGGDVMRPSFASTDSFNGLSGDDIANIRGGYAAGVGSVTTLEDTGIWVNGSWAGLERGTFALPFDTVTEAANGVPPLTTGVVVHILPGNYYDRPRITQAMILRAEPGGVVIGK